MKINVTKLKIILANSQMTCTKLADVSGISRQSISTILNRGTCEPKTAGKIAKGLGIAVEEIIKEV